MYPLRRYYKTEPNKIKEVTIHADTREQAIEILKSMCKDIRVLDTNQ